MNTNQVTTSGTEMVKYSTQLPPELIKWVKLQAIEMDVKDYEVIQKALETYRATAEPRKVGLFDLAVTSR